MRIFLKLMRHAPFVAAGPLAILISSGCSSIEPVAIRGHLLRRELVNTEHNLFFACQLITAEQGKPVLVFHKYDQVTYLEIPVYEKVLEYRDADDPERHRRDYRPVIGEVIKGQQTERQETLQKGPWANLRLVIDEFQVRTDNEGRYIDSHELILNRFDDLTVAETTIRAEHPEYGTCELSITRAELLRSLGVEQQEPSASTPRENLQMLCHFPEKLTAGEQFEITVEVQNAGNRPSSPVYARLIGRHAWLSDRNFYLGSVPPGESRSFTRMLRVPKQQSQDIFFATIGFRDMRLGRMPEKNIPLAVSVTGSQAY